MDDRRCRRKKRLQPAVADKHPERERRIEIAYPVAIFLILTVAATWPLILHPCTSIYSPTDHVSTDAYAVLSQIDKGITMQGVSWYYHSRGLMAPYDKAVGLPGPVGQLPMMYVFGTLAMGLVVSYMFLEFYYMTWVRQDSDSIGRGESVFVWSMALVGFGGMGIGVYTVWVIILGLFLWLDWRESLKKVVQI